MQDDSFGNDPKTLWQNQPAEVSNMTLKLIRMKARELQAKTRRELFGTIAVALVAIAFSALGLTRGGGPAMRMVFVVALVWALAGQYFLHSGMWSSTLQPDAALSAGLEFCRHELERRRRIFRRVLWLSAGPLLLAIGAFTLPIVAAGIRLDHGLSAKTIPFLALLGLWLVALLYFRSQGRRELEREINELNDVEK
jgi:hypothetical protein